MDPWGEERSDLRAGIVSSTMANIFRGKHTKPYQPEDFMPKLRDEEEPPETEGQDMLEVLLAFGANLRAQVVVNE